MKQLIPILLIVSTIFFNVTAQNSFKDIAATAGVGNSMGFNVGVAFGDFNDDHLEDIYITRRLGPNHLYKNIGKGMFVEVGQAAKVNYLGNSRTAVWGDLNNDGYLDLYVGNWDDPDILYLNNGDETFTDITLDANIKNTGKVFSSNFADVNKDGWLDIYVSNLHNQNILYLNTGIGAIPTFINYTTTAGLIDTRTCMGVVFYDIDKDGDEDLYVTHDGRNPNTLYLNDGHGIFEEVGVQAGVDYKGFGMGADIADVNNDGWPDIYITNLAHNVLYINDGAGNFTNVAKTAGVDDIGMGWGTTLFDFDNDGQKDIYVANDSYFSPNPNILYQNKGNNEFEVSSDVAFSSMQGSYGVAHADIDNDGTQEIAVANINTQDVVELFKQETTPNNWIGFELEGVASNRSAIGTRIEMVDNLGVIHSDQITSGNGYAGQHSLRVHFGLGAATELQEATIYWTNGLVQQLDNLTLGQYYSVQEGEAPKNMEVGTSTATVTLTEDNNFSIFPNPSKGQFKIDLPNSLKEPFQLQVLNAQGQIRYQKEFSDFSNKTATIDLQGEKGVFFIVFKTEQQQLTKQLLLFDY